MCRLGWRESKIDRVAHGLNEGKVVSYAFTCSDALRLLLPTSSAHGVTDHAEAFEVSPLAILTYLLDATMSNDYHL